MSYTVIKAFFDKTDNLKPYKVGDSYSHEDEKRIAFLIEKGFLEAKSKQPPKEKSKKRTRKKASD